MKDSYILVFLSFVLVIVGKIIFDFLKGGRHQYVSIKDCEKIRTACCLPQVKQHVSALNERTKKEDELIRDIHMELQELKKSIQTVYLEIIKNTRERADK